MKPIWLSAALLPLLAACAGGAKTSAEVKPAFYSPYEYNLQNCIQLADSYRKSTALAARIAAEMDASPRDSAGLFYRRAGFAPRLADARGRAGAARALFDRSDCSDNIGPIDGEQATVAIANAEAERASGGHPQSRLGGKK